MKQGLILFMKKTRAQYEKERRERLKAEGREKLELYPLKEHKPLIKRFAKDLEDESAILQPLT